MKYKMSTEFSRCLHGLLFRGAYCDRCKSSFERLELTQEDKNVRPRKGILSQKCDRCGKTGHEQIDEGIKKWLR